jgi:hypothetical protein
MASPNSHRAMRKAAALKNRRNICFFCRICTSPKPIPHISVDIKFIPIRPGMT